MDRKENAVHNLFFLNRNKISQMITAHIRKISSKSWIIFRPGKEILILIYNRSGHKFINLMMSCWSTSSLINRVWTVCDLKNSMFSTSNNGDLEVKKKYLCRPIGYEQFNVRKTQLRTIVCVNGKRKTNLLLTEKTSLQLNVHRHLKPLVWGTAWSGCFWAWFHKSA